MPSNSNHELQGRLEEFSESPPTSPTHDTFNSPPIPPNQDELELLNPIDTLDALRNETGDIRAWLTYIRDQYIPPEEKSILLLYPCASKKPMPDSKTYDALSTTLSQFSDADSQRIHVVTVSEPMALIPLEFQDGDRFLYDNPGLFEWWVKENDHQWDKQAQQQCLRILGEHIAGFLERAIENDWYEEYIACVRHITAYGNHSGDQTHRQMLETAEALTGHELQWLPSEETVQTLTDAVGPMGWQMNGVAHDVAQTELADALSDALSTQENYS